MWRLPLKNVTSDTIRIQKFNTSCACTLIEPHHLLIQPGETATVQLTIDLTHRSYSEEGIARRSFALSVQPVTSHTRKGGFGWQIHGTIRSRVTLEARTVHFGEQPVHGQPAASRLVFARVHVPCQGLDVAVDPRIASAVVKRGEDDPNRFEITIAVNPELSPGIFETDVKISVVELSGRSEPAVTLPVAGIMQPETRLLPALVFLGPKAIGQIAEATVVVQAPSNAKVVFDHIETDNREIQVDPIEIAGSSTHQAFLIKQKVTREGEQRAIVQFILRDRSDKLVQLPVEVTYCGEANKKAPTNKVERK